MEEQQRRECPSKTASKVLCETEEPRRKSYFPVMSRSSAALVFTTCRYFVYMLLFLRGILAAKFLGPQLLGVFGFLVLMQQYLSYCGLGVQYAVNVKLAICPDEDNSKIISTAVTLSALIGCGLVIIALAIHVLHVPLFHKYSFCQYAPLVALIAGATIVQAVFINVYRVYNKLAKIAASDVLSAILLLILTLGFRGYALIMAVLVGLFLSTVLSDVLFAFHAPFTFSFQMDSLHVHELLVAGIPLLIYNLGFYLVMLAAQSVISIYYSVEAMGYYTLSSSIATAVLLGFNSIAWIAYPSILGKTRSGLPDAEVARTTDRANVLFGTGVFLLVFLAILVLPALFLVLPAYKPAYSTATILLLSQALLASCMGYNCLAIARKKEMQVAGVTMLSVLIVLAFAVPAGIKRFDIVWVAVAVLIGSLLCAFLQARVGSVLLGSSSNPRPIVSAGTLVSIGLCLAGAIWGYPGSGAVCGMTAFVIGNASRLFELWQYSWNHLRSFSLSQRHPA